MSEEQAAEVVTDEIVVEPEVVESDDKTTEEVSEESAKKEEKPSESSTEKPDKKDKVQDRIDELTKLRRETERDRDYWKEQAQKQRPEQKVEAKPIEPGKTLADFEYDESKYTAYIMDTAQAEAKRVVESETSRQKASRSQSDFQAKEAGFVAKTEDYMSVTRNPSLQITQEMVGLIQESDIGPELLYHLGKNESATANLSKLPPLAMAREIGKIEARLSNPVEKKSVSNAPAPTPKISGVDASLKVKASSKDSDKLSTNDWLKRRNKEIESRQ